MMADEFNIMETARLQVFLLETLATDKADIQIKIGALRSAADLLQNCITMTAIAANFATALKPKH